MWLVALFHLKKTVEEFVQIVFHPCVLNILNIDARQLSCDLAMVSTSKRPLCHDFR